MQPDRLIAISILIAAAILPAVAGEADVEAVTATRASDGTWAFEVTVRHADEGWGHYANRWDVVAPDGTVLGTRTLHHPHENEQPFTRSMAGVSVPGGVKTVTIRAHDSVHGEGGREFTVALPD
ncbi:MAG: hypothetical protein V2I51_03475 [Anderseniella sp.]|jgi:hypothetical protein|nr:hypothetical protein [Anderseniella sp.]